MRITKLLMTIVLVSSTAVFAQKDAQRGRMGEFHQDLTAEQLAVLKTKTMTLALDLSEKQQEAIFELNLANAEFRKKKMEERKANSERSKPTPEERYTLENARLDRMIAQQQELKKILNDEQFDQWKKMQMYQHGHRKGDKQREGRRGK